MGNCHAGPDNPQIFEIDHKKRLGIQRVRTRRKRLGLWQVLEGKEAAMVLKKPKALK